MALLGSVYCDVYQTKNVETNISSNGFMSCHQVALATEELMIDWSEDCRSIDNDDKDLMRNDKCGKKRNKNNERQIK